MVLRVEPSRPISRKVLRMESKDEFWMDFSASAGIFRGLSAASVLENQGSEDRLFHFGALPSCSSSSSECNSSTDNIDGAAEAIAILQDGEVRAMLQDAEVRALLRKVTINEGVLNMAIQSLGGGEKGLENLMGYIMVWVKQQRDVQPSFQQPPPPPPSSPAWNFSTVQDVFLQPSSDAFQILSGSVQPPPTKQLLDQEMRCTQRLKSRKLMTGEPEMGAGLGGADTGFCPSSFISIPEDCKLEVMSPDVVAPCISQQHVAMPFAGSTPSMATKAARRHRMSRQRQSFHARAASSVATTPVSVGGGSLWNSNVATSPAVTSSGAQTPPARARVAASREVRSMECLTFLLQKELRPSDVSHLGRIILPKKEAEQCMPPLETREGVSIQMEDFDSGQAWNLRYSVIAPPKLGPSPQVTSGTSSFWPNNRSRMYVLENTAAFVTSHGLVEGDLLVIYRVLRGGYVLRGMKNKDGGLDVEPLQGEFACSSDTDSVEGQPSLHVNGTLVQQLYGCCPPGKFVKEEPVNLDDDPYLNDVILSMGPSFESDSSCIQKLDRFPSLTLDFPFEDLMAVTRTVVLN